MESFRCTDCGKQPPEAESAYTLIGGKSGWRLARRRETDGSIVTEWRCAECWAEHRKAPATGASSGKGAGAPRVGTPSTAPRAPAPGRGKDR